MFSRRRHQRPDDSDDFAHDDLELSFSSSVSLNSPPQNPAELTPDSDYGVPMDISPLPPPKSSGKPMTRPRASTMAARIFNDVSNKEPAKGAILQRGRSGSTSIKKIQRPGLPTEWRSGLIEPPSPMDDAMDVDTSFIINHLPTSVSSPIIPQSAASPNRSFSNLFYDTASPGPLLASPVDRHFPKRRSTSPERVLVFQNLATESSPSQSPGLPSSPSDRHANRGHTTKPFFLADDASYFPRRPRRPTLSGNLRDSDSSSVRSAFPVLDQAENINSERITLEPPPQRRAFSATLAAQFSEDSSFEEPDGSSPAQAYAQRQHARTLRRRDGTENFFPTTGATVMLSHESPSRRIVGTGLPGFGDNERVGKILPCRSVPEDGLMRITPQTLNALMDGAFNDRIHDFHVIDCRFDYEYNGGHIPGAVNINTPDDVEKLLLGPSLTKPKPSVSGDAYRKTVLVFHCEFSMKRAPTFAKHLRAKDRSMNHSSYPKIHYPEVYLLEGGYCGYFKVSASRCEPQKYVRMDDPSHAASRREDLDHFRKAKFGRHKSYAYGDANGRMSTSMQSSKRNTMPSNGGSSHVFAAGTAARARRGGANSSLKTLAEDSAVTADEDDTDTDIGDSPCPRPPPTKKGRAPLSRAETYGPSRMPY
ncbi:hypothetical protein CPB85DRAFT_1374416 [Mucidula mucida]|nr:hypothetical protein CPB85DRAFT_1374416 [Mucidula mucida]